MNKEKKPQNKKVGKKSWVTETKDTPIKLNQTNIRLNFDLKLCKYSQVKGLGAQIIISLFDDLNEGHSSSIGSYI